MPGHTSQELYPEGRELRRTMSADGRWRIQLRKAPPPDIGPTDVLVRVRAASIQRSDCDDAAANDLASLDLGPTDRSLIIGSDAAGEVVKVGQSVTSFTPGQRVVSLVFADYLDHPLTPTTMDHALGWTVDGVFADYAVLRETGVAPMPDHLSFEEAATLPSSALTAWSALGLDDGWTRAGDVVVVQGTGGIASFVILFAVSAGARVFVTGGSEEKLAIAQGLGASEIIHSRPTDDWSDEVLRRTGGRGADVVVDLGGASTLAQSARCIAYEGNLAIVGTLGGFDASLPAFTLMSKAAVARGIFGGSRRDFLSMCNFIGRHRIRPVLGHLYPFDEFERAFADLKDGKFVGKLVLRF